MREPGDAEREGHGDGGLQVAPLGGVVAGPDGRVALAAGEGGAGKDKGPGEG